MQQKLRGAFRICATVTNEGLATVTDVNYITGNLIVKPIDNDGIPFKIHRDKVKMVSRSNKSNSPKFDL